MVKIVIDTDHGLKASSKDDAEWNYNDLVVRATIQKLITYKDVEVLRVDDPTGKTAVPLRERARKANEWNADIYVSIHHGSNMKSNDISAAFTPRIVKAMGGREGGIEQTSFHVLRDTEFPALFTGAGFTKSIVDIIKLRDHKLLKAEGVAIAEGLAAYIKLQPSPSERKKKTELDSHNMMSKELVSAATIILRQLESDREGIIPGKWLDIMQDGTLTESDAIGLLYVVLHRWLSN